MIDSKTVSNKQMDLIVCNALFDVFLENDVDQTTREIIKRYWDYDFEEGKFRPVLPIQKQFGLSSRQLSLLIKANCIAYRKDERCEECGNCIVEYKSKTALSDHYGKEKHFCSECENKFREKHYLRNSGENCFFCGKPVSINVKDYCLTNKKRFGGRIYCFDHQRKFYF